MAAIMLVGNDGAVALPSGYDLNVKVWAASVSYVSSDTTGYAATGKTRRLGVIDITGSLAGTPTIGNSGTPWGTVTSNSITGKQAGGTLTLSAYGGTATSATSAAMLQFDVVFSSFAFNSDKNGDHGLTVNYEMNDANGPTVVWATTLA